MNVKLSPYMYIVPSRHVRQGYNGTCTGAHSSPQEDPSLTQGSLHCETENKQNLREQKPKISGVCIEVFLYLCVNVCYNNVHVLQNPRAKLTQSLEKIFSGLKTF